MDGKPRAAHQVTIACEFHSRVVKIQDTNIKIQIWDTAGQENFRSVTRSYYKCCTAAIIAYDITKKHSFERVKSWIHELRENSNTDVSIILVGNKKDLEDERYSFFLEL